MSKLKSKLGISWILLTIAFTLHVIDESVFDFLPFYNSVVMNAKEKFTFFPFPDFTFQVWLSGLIVVLLILYLLSPFAIQSRRWIVYFSLFYGAIMLFNGILHIIASSYFQKVIGGLYSSPLLIIASIFLLWYAFKELKAT
jgi:hypothetical protein